VHPKYPWQNNVVTKTISVSNAQNMEATHSHTYLRENWADAAFFFPPKSTLVVTNSSKEVTLNSKRWDDVILLDALVGLKAGGTH